MWFAKPTFIVQRRFLLWYYVYRPLRPRVSPSSAGGLRMFQSDLVIELLKDEKDFNTRVAENNTQPNLLRKWKKEFFDHASVVFNDKREDNLKENLAEERKERAEHAKKVGQLTMQVDWLKKSEEICGFNYERKLLVPTALLKIKKIPAFFGVGLLDIKHTSIYYKGAPISDEKLVCKELINHLHTDNTTWGIGQMPAQLKTRGY